MGLDVLEDGLEFILKLFLSSSSKLKKFDV